MARNTRMFSAVRRNSGSDFPFPAHWPSWSPSMALRLAPNFSLSFPKALSSKKLMHLLCIYTTTVSTLEP